MITTIEKDILVALGEFEVDDSVTVLYAVENGSRVWGFDTPSSDYDIRFVYKHPLEEYHKIHLAREDITYNNGLLDFVGFDIHKFMNLLWKSNPTTIEWLQCEKPYISHLDFAILYDFVRDNFNPKALFMHYYHLALTNYAKYVLKQDMVRNKKLLYVLRGIHNAMIVQKRGILPPVKFLDGIEYMERDIYNVYVRGEIDNILNNKDNETEKVDLTVILDYIANMFAFLGEAKVRDKIEDKPYTNIYTHFLDEVLWYLLNSSEY